MLDEKAIHFTPNNGPNVIQHPMAPHGGPIVNAIIDEGEVLNLVLNVDLLASHFPFVKIYLFDNGIFSEHVHDCCKCKEQARGYADLKARIQDLINDGSLQLDRISGYIKVTK